jgi:Carboxypeptidase regulatory-like domain
MLSRGCTKYYPNKNYDLPLRKQRTSNASQTKQSSRHLQMQNRYRQNAGLSQQHNCRSLILCVLLLCLSTALSAQPISGFIASDLLLPEAPGWESSLPQSSPPDTSASISGTVLDINQGIVANAKVTLETQGGVVEHEQAADNAGDFSFKNLPAGTFKVKIEASGLQTFESNEITLHPGDKYRFPKIALPIAGGTVAVTVTVTESQLAEEQVQAQVQQRVFGVFPNFYTSFVWNAAPLRPGLKFKLAIRSATDPVTFFTTGFLAGIQQARDTYPDYGQGAVGFGKRYGADYGDIFIGRMLGAAVFPTLFRQDPRYFYQGSGSVTSRIWHALSSALITRGDNGRRQFNYSHILGNFAAGGISNFYRPDEDRGIALAVDNALLHTATNAAGNLAREFALRNITTKVPAYAKGRRHPATKSLAP